MRKSRLLPILLVFVLVLSLLPTTALADNEVAEVNGTKYTTLENAVTSASDGQTVKLLDNVTITSVISISKKISLDLGGKTLSVNVTEGVTSASGGDVTITGGNITTDGEYSDLLNANAGSITLGTGLTVSTTKGAAIQAKNGGKVVVDGATVTGSEKWATAFATGNGSSIEVKSGSIAGTTNDHVTLSVKDGATATISGGTVSSSSSTAAVAKGAGSVITITGGTVSNSVETPTFCAAYSASDGKIVLNGGTITSTYGGGLIATSNSTVEVASGTINATNGYAVLAHEGNASATISGGTVTGAVGAGSSNNGDNNTLTISGGTIRGSVYKTKGTVNITGGTFTDNVTSLLDTNSYEELSTGEVVPTGTAVAQIWTTKYKTLAAAVGAATDSSTVKLLKDTVEDVTLSNSLTIDLGGHTLTVQSATGIKNTAGTSTIKNGTIQSTKDDPIYATGGTLILGDNLTITSSSSVLWAKGGTITVDGASLKGTHSAYVAAFAENNGVINIKSGSITSTSAGAVNAGAGGTVNLSGTGEISTSSTQYVAVWVYGGGVFNMTGGTVNGGSESAFVPVGSGTSTISGGTLTSSNTFTVGVYQGGKLTVSGGNIKNTGSGVALQAGSSTYTGTGAITINDGTIESSNGKSVAIVTSKTEGSTITINGGKFSDDEGNDTGITRANGKVLIKGSDNYYVLGAPISSALTIFWIFQIHGIDTVQRLV